jgi:hypothetical protein
VKLDGRWNERREYERRASNDRWIAFGMTFIDIKVGNVGHNIRR